MLTTGMTTRIATTAIAKIVKPQRTQAGSSFALRTLMPATGLAATNTASVLMTHAPALQQIDNHQHRKGNHQQDDRNRGRLAIRKFFQARNTQDRSNLGFVRHIAGTKNDGPVPTYP